MASPPKPWERGGRILNPGLNQRQATFNPDQINSFSATHDFGNGGGGNGGRTASAGVRPTLPPRPTNHAHPSATRSLYNNYNSYSYGGYGGSPYSGYGGGYGGYGGFGAYGGYGGYNRFGMMGNGAPDEIGFIQVAEESSRQAFQSIESIVHAFGSVSMMLESTYHAVYSSFRAVLGVAEHFSRMKSHFAQIFSALAVVRTLRWILRKLLYLIGLRSQDPNLESVWRTAANGAASSALLTEADLKASRSSWPIVMFLAVVFGGPYLIWRLLSSLVTPKVSKLSHGWKKGVSEHYAAVAVYDFEAGNKRELPFQAGQPLFLAPKDQQPQVRGWLLASNGTHTGLVPANYIKILGLRKGSAQPLNSLHPVNSLRPVVGSGEERVAARIPSMPAMKQTRQYPYSSAGDTVPESSSMSPPSSSDVSGVQMMEETPPPEQQMSRENNTPRGRQHAMEEGVTLQSVETPPEEIAFPLNDIGKEEADAKNSSGGESSDSSSYVEVSHEMGCNAVEEKDAAD